MEKGEVSPHRERLSCTLLLTLRRGRRGFLRFLGSCRGSLLHVQQARALGTQRLGVEGHDALDRLPGLHDLRQLSYELFTRNTFGTGVLDDLNHLASLRRQLLVLCHLARHLQLEQHGCLLSGTVKVTSPYYKIIVTWPNKNVHRPLKLFVS